MIRRKRVIATILAGYLGGFMPAYAAISQQFNQDAAGLGDAQAGGAASALDASTEFYNPAGLVLMNEQQVVFGVNLNAPTYEFNGSTTYASPPVGLLSPPSLTEEGNGGAFYNLPFLHYAAPISDQWAFGFGVSSPFAMHSSWGSDSSAAGNATSTDLSTYDVSTDLAYAVTPKFSIGAGLDFVRVIVSDYNNESQGGTQGSTSLSGSQWDKGWHGGLLYQFTPGLRAGLSYHSKINYEVSGPAEYLDGNNAVIQSTNDFVLTSTLPAYTTASVYYAINPTWALEGSVNYTQWDQANTVSYENVPTATGITSYEAQTYDLKNTWRTALGLHYTLSPQMMLRAGAGYETSPYTSTETVYLGAPVGSSYDISCGLQYNHSDTLSFDLGWTHLFYLDQNVDTTNTTSASTTSGQFSGSSDILGAQVRWTML